MKTPGHLLVSLAALALVLAASSAGADENAAAAAPAPTAQTAPAPTAAAPKPIEITEKTFRCMRDMTHVRGFYVDNIAGNLDGTLAVARSPTGGVYPPGSIVQLFPNEVMVKRETGFNPATHDWEFFELDVDKKGSKIRKRGFVDIKNRFGGNCFACHVQAKPEWDMVCETGHGCQKLPVAGWAIRAMQNSDPRCDNSKTPWHQRMIDWTIRALTPL